MLKFKRPLGTLKLDKSSVLLGMSRIKPQPHTSGEGVMVSKDSEGGERKIIHMSKGSCVRTPIGVIHTFYAISPVTAIAMLSKKWDDCNPPIVRMEIK